MTSDYRTISEFFFGRAFLAAELFRDRSAAGERRPPGITRRVSFAASATVLAAGEAPTGVYILADGAAELLDAGGDVVRPVEPGELLGLTEAIANLPGATGVRTVTPCLFEFIGREDFARFLRHEPEVCFRLVQMLGTNLRHIYRLFSA